MHTRIFVLYSILIEKYKEWFIAIKRTKPLWYNNLVSVISLERDITVILNKPNEE